MPGGLWWRKSSWELGKMTLGSGCTGLERKKRGLSWKVEVSAEWWAEDGGSSVLAQLSEGEGNLVEPK
jgi:hypothetical protein